MKTKSPADRQVFLFISHDPDDINLSTRKGVCLPAIGVILFLLIASTCHAYTDTQIVDAIYKAEGGSQATYLYGIRSVKYDSPEEARRICLNSVRNNIKRWEKAAKPEDFITFMSRRYCPVGCDNDWGCNKNWVKNVNYFLRKEVR